MNAYRDVMKIQRDQWFWWKFVGRNQSLPSIVIYFKDYLMGADYMIEIIVDIDVAYVTLMYKIK